MQLRSLLNSTSGYETTANAITYGLVTLALRQDVQSKVIEEIDAVYAEAADAGREELTYQQDFEKLKYTYGFMVSSPPKLHARVS